MLKSIILIFPTIIFLLVFNNCSSSQAIDLLAPEIEVDLDGNIVYQAVDPNNSFVCMEINLPIDYKPEDVQGALSRHLESQVPERTQQFMSDYLELNLDEIEVAYGACPEESRDEFVCENKNLGEEIPIEHSYKVVTYDGTATGTDLLFVENLCDQL